MGTRQPQRKVKGDDPSISALFDDGHAIDEALRLGVQDALLRHKRLGQRVATWEGGRVVVLEADEIPISAPGDASDRRSHGTKRAFPRRRRHRHQTRFGKSG
jgi:hypothetical protein